MTIEEFEEKGYYISTQGTAITYGRIDTRNEMNEIHDIDDYEIYEYVIFDKDDNFIEVFNGIDETMEFIKDMEE